MAEYIQPIALGDPPSPPPPNFFHMLYILSWDSKKLLPQLPAGFELCEEGDEAMTFFILHDGEVAAHSSDAPIEDAQLKAPALLGQVALLQEQDPKYYQRQCTYRYFRPPSPFLTGKIHVLRQNTRFAG